MYFHGLGEFMEMLLGNATNLEKSLVSRRARKKSANEGGENINLPKSKI